MNNNKSLTVEEIFNLAVQSHQEGKTDIAQDLYNQVLKINPSHSQVLNNLAIIFTNLKEYQKAIDCYEKAIKINPNYADVHNNLGVVFKGLRNDQKAKECYEKAIELNPNFVNAHYNLGLVFKELREHQKAKKSFKKVIELNPNHVDANNNLGSIFTDFKEYQKAKKCFEKAIEINPDYSSAHNNLGAVFQKSGEDKKAKECFEKAIEINPDYSSAHNNLGAVFQKSGEDKKAKECYEKAIKINPGYALAHDNLKTMLNRQILLSKIEKAKKSQNRNIISFKKKIHKKLFGSDLKLNSNPFISHRKVEEELINIIYQLNYKYLNKTNNTFYGNGRHSSNFQLFENNYPILKKMEDELIIIMEQAVKSDIFIMDSFFNVLSNGGGSNWHCHTGGWDDVHNLNKQKYSLTYHIAIGDQKSNEPGILKFKDPEEEILPSKGMVMIFPASRSHSAVYNGKVDRVMIGVNFYSII
jgi:tetratricopeptide (TPR) repeat protein